MVIHEISLFKVNMINAKIIHETYSELSEK